MGLRLVKKTVNQDNPTVYHLFFADEKGSAGSDLTFFEFPGVPPGRAGAGDVHRIVWRVGSRRVARLLGGAAGRQRGRVRAGRGRSALRRPRGARPRAGGGRGRRRAADRRPPRGAGRAGAAGLPRRLRLQRRPRGQQRAARGARVRAGRRRSWEARGASRGGLYVYEEPPEERSLQGAGSVHHVAWASTIDEHEALARPRDRRRRPADPGDRPLLLPLDLLPRAERRALRDRHPRARASPSTSRSSTSARSSRCRPTTSTCGPRSNRTCARSSTRAPPRRGERQLRLARRRPGRRLPPRRRRRRRRSCWPSTGWSRSSCSDPRAPRRPPKLPRRPPRPCTSPGAGAVPEAAAALLDRGGRGHLVALGGGRVIDAAKAVASVTGAAWRRSRRRCRGRR